MHTLRIYALLNALANNLVVPFVSFLTASAGIVGEPLALVSSAGTTFPGLVQYALSRMKTEAKTLVVAGTGLAGLLWVVMAAFQLSGSAFVVTFLAIEALSGASLFGWMLLMESVSRTARGAILARYQVYAYLGGLGATMFAGVVVGPQLSLMRYFFAGAGVLYLVNAWVISRDDARVEASPGTGKVSPRLRRFLGVNSLFVFVWSLAWPLFPLAQVNIFQMSETEVAVIAVIGGLSSVLLQRVIGRVADRRRRHMMFAGRFMLASFPLVYALASSVYQIYVVNIVSGFTNSTGIAYTSYLFENSIDKRKGIGLYNLANALAAAAGSSLSGLAYVALSGGDAIAVLRTMLMVVAGARIAVSFLYLTLKEGEGGAVSVGGKAVGAK